MTEPKPGALKRCRHCHGLLGLTMEERDAAIGMLEDGTSITATAIRFSVHRATIHRLVGRKRKPVDPDQKLLPFDPEAPTSPI